MTIKYGGRLGNNLIQFISANIFSKKFGYSLLTPAINDKLNFGEYFNLQSSVGKKVTEPQIVIDDKNFLNFLNRDEVPDAHYVFSDYFQIKNFVLEYEEKIKSEFKLKNEINNDEVFVIYRIGDIENKKQMLPIEYYRECLSEVNFKSGYITSDTINHHNVVSLANEFNLKIFNEDCPMRTIDFARSFDKLILSEGTFSWWVGTLSNASQIFYNERDRFWHGDIFVNKFWIKKKYE